VLSALALLLVACGSDEPPKQVTPDDSGADVIVTTLDTIFTWYPGKDESTRDAYQRASPYMTESLAALANSGEPMQQTAQWVDWAERKATVTAETFVVAGEHPPDTPDRVIREAVITQTVTDPAGAKATLSPLNAHVTAIRTDAGWRVSDIEIQ
jgi:hypothetical protein